MSEVKSVYHLREEMEKHIGISQAVRAGDFLFLSGCISWDMECKPLHPHDAAAQMKAVYAEIDGILKQHGLDARHIVKETIYCRDMKALDEAAIAERLDYYKNTTPPASTWIEVSAVGYPETVMEIEVTAYFGK